FNLRNYELDFGTLDEVGSTDDSAYRVEIMTVGQLHFATTAFGIDFQPEMMWVTTDPVTGMLSYTVGSYNGQDRAQVDAAGAYESVVAPAISILDSLFESYVSTSRGLAVRMALQGGLAEFARGIEYRATPDQFHPTTDRNLAPMFEAIFEAIPTDAVAASAYLTAWDEILQVVYADYHLGATSNPFGSVQKFDEKFILHMMLPGFDAAKASGLELDLLGAAHVLGIDEEKLRLHGAADAEVTGTTRKDYVYMTAGDQTYRGGQDEDIYYFGPGRGTTSSTTSSGACSRRSSVSTS
ncbi:MAG: hypothetical protein ABL908_10420, partial [Hyphomicrobium sp.]